MRCLAFAILAACGGGSDTPPDAPMFDPLTGVGTVELVQGGDTFTAGPQWRAATNDLVFTDIPADTISRFTTGTPVVHRMPSGLANGLAVDGNGALIAAEHGSRSVTRDGVSIASMFE